MMENKFLNIAVTNRKLCTCSFEEQIKLIADKKLFDAVILREKDLSECEYFELAKKIKKLCDNAELKFVINNFENAAIKLPCEYLQISFKKSNEIPHLKKYINKIGVSVHSVNEAVTAQNFGADFLIAGHIYETNCKKGLKPRGTAFLKSVCDAVEIPVFAIGGVSPANFKELAAAGAKGACQMSGAMKAR